MHDVTTLGEPAASFHTLEHGGEDLGAWLSGLLHAADAGYAPAQYRLGRALLELAGAEREAIVAPYQTLPPPKSNADDQALGRKLIQLAARRSPLAAGWWALNRTPIPPTTDERPQAMVLRGLAALAKPSADRLEALRWLGAAARTRDAAACFWLSQLLREGQRDAVAEEAARRALQAAAEAGHLEAGTQWGLELLHGGEEEVGLAWLTRSAEREDPWAQYQLGRVYHRGVHAPWTPPLALLWLGRAADAGNGHAHAIVEALEGLVPPGSPPPSTPAWFGYACEAGGWDSPGALTLMARCFEHGEGTARNDTMAIDLWLRAAQEREPQALARLASGFTAQMADADTSLDAHEHALGLYEAMHAQGTPASLLPLQKRFGDLPDAQLALARRCEAEHDQPRALRWYGKLQANADASQHLRQLAALRVAQLQSTRGGQSAREALCRVVAGLVDSACMPFRFWATEQQHTAALAAALAPAARALRGLVDGNDDAAFQLAFLAAYGLGVPHDPDYADTLLAGPVRRGHAGACGLAALLLANEADLARVAHFEQDGPDPAAVERKADQALATAAAMAERHLKAGGYQPAPMPPHLAAAWRLAEERLTGLGPQADLRLPGMRVVDEYQSTRIGLVSRPERLVMVAEACVPDILSPEAFGPSMPAVAAETLRELEPQEQEQVEALACLHVAAAMGDAAAGEKARGRALELPLEHVGAARSAATAWWRRREELGDFAEIRWAPAWREVAEQPATP